MKVSPEQEKIVEQALRANPMYADADIARKTGASRNYVKLLRRKLGLWTSRRIRFTDGKPQVYHVPPPAGLKLEECLAPIEGGLDIPDDFLRKLHLLVSKSESEYREAYNLICDVLEVTVGEAN